MLIGQGEQLRAVFGDHLLVGRDDVLTAFDGAFDDLIGRIQAARDLDQNFDLRIVGEFERVVEECELRSRTVSARISNCGLSRSSWTTPVPTVPTPKMPRVVFAVMNSLV